MNNRLLIIAPYQFGELTDCYYWAKYATLDGWDVTYIGYKYIHRGIKERVFPGVHNKSILHIRNRFLLGFLFYAKCIWEILIHQHYNIIVCRMPMCHILPIIFKRRNVILDVRTLSVSTNKNIRESQDNKLRKLKKFFAKCTVISQGVGNKIGMPYELLPLGAESLSTTTKRFDKLRFFYIGTFDGRNLSTFIEGLAHFKKKSGIECSFDIIGGGDKSEVKKIKDTINRCEIKDIFLHGYLSHEEAKPLFDSCNIGVCYIPITDYYQHQPPTKLYEYLLSGMACVATETFSNKEVITKDNGIIIKDSKEDICNGLYRLLYNMPHYDSSFIVENAKKYHWQTIFQEYLKKQLIQ